MTRGQEALRKIMAERGLSQADVAKAVRAGDDLVSRWLENDPAKRRTKPSLEMAGRLHEAFEIDPLDWGREIEGAEHLSTGTDGHGGGS